MGMDYHTYVYCMLVLDACACIVCHLMYVCVYVCIYVPMVMWSLGLFEVSVTKWMDLACCHIKWTKVKYVASWFCLHVSVVVCICGFTVDSLSFGHCRCPYAHSTCAVCAAARDAHICMLTLGGMQRSATTS